MKKVIFCAIFLAIATKSFCQETKPAQPLTHQDYLEKSKRQKSGAWVLLGSGTVLMGTGFLIGGGNDASFSNAATGVVIGGIGLLSAIGSIPLFIASAKNKHKSLSLGFKYETAPQFVEGNFINRPVPSVSLRIRL